MASNKQIPGEFPGTPGNLDLYLVHDYLIQMGGAERVVAAMSKAHPEAPIYTSITDYDRLLDPFPDRIIRNSVLQRLPGAVKNFKKLFLLYPAAFGAMQLPRRRAAWISTSMFAKCVRPHPETVSFCYIHNPPRFLYQSDDYLEGEVKSSPLQALVRAASPLMRIIDKRATRRMNHLIANSRTVAARIEAIYNRKADVIHPPVSVEEFQVGGRSEDFYLVLSRLIAYKRIDLAVEAFRGLDRKLIVVGEGSDRKRIESLAGRNVEVRGWVSDEERKQLLMNTRGLIFPGYEDFGISPVEAMACGKPVIAFNKGGATETVVHRKTGILFEEQSPDSLRAALKQAEETEWDPVSIRRHAQNFSEAAFLSRMDSYIEEKLAKHFR